jgi:N-acetylmuramoyl-L-alanine amidase
MKIAIDAGHGGHDPGAVGKEGLKESAVNLEVSKRLSKLLEAAGISTILTRNTEIYLGLGDRCEVANDWGAHYFISIHCNSDGPDAVGIETLYKTDKGKAIALPIQAALILATGDHDRGLKPRSDLYVLNGTYMPAILPEIGFISHPDTEKKLRDSAYLDLIVKAIHDGILKHLLIPPPKM